MSDVSKPLLHEIVMIVGPTGTGKSDLAVEAAVERGAVIVNADSVQLFKGVDIGSAKPDAEMRKRCPHELFDVIEKGQICTAGDYRRLALPLIENQIQKQPVFVVGGSGFYIQALEYGMFDVPEVPADVVTKVNQDLAEFGNQKLWQELKERDPITADKIHPNDTYRLKRALSLLRVNPKTLSQAKAEFDASREDLSKRFPLRKLGLSLNREKLRARLTRRAERMLESGLIEEVQGLIAEGLRDWAPLKSIGYAEIVRFLDGEIPRSELRDAIVKSSMALAKRQLTWFKRDPRIRWFDAEEQRDLAKEYLLAP